MSIRPLSPLLAALATAWLASGCTTPPTEEQVAQRCQSWRNFARTKPVDYVMEECSHQMGKETCARCLGL